VAPPAVTLSRLLDRLKASEGFVASKAKYQERSQQIAEEHDKQVAALQREAIEHSGDIPVDPRWLCQALNESIPSDAVIVEETTVHRTLIQNMIPRTQPMSYIARVTGGLGVAWLRAGRETGPERTTGLRAHRRRRLSLQSGAVMLGVGSGI
jgi:thiamine pyrophosphate-dependent acetolactate synthase large subunit-like protein